MSSVPPNIIGPIAQSGAQQQSASRALEGERAHQSNAAEMGSKMNQQATDAIGEADNDTRVHTDAEGTGSQGRADEDEQSESSPSPSSEDDQGIRRDDDGQLHVDLEA